MIVGLSTKHSSRQIHAFGKNAASAKIKESLGLKEACSERAHAHASVVCMVLTNA